MGNTLGLKKRRLRKERVKSSLRKLWLNRRAFTLARKCATQGVSPWEPAAQVVPASGKKASFQGWSAVRSGPSSDGSYVVSFIHWNACVLAMELMLPLSGRKAPWPVSFSCKAPVQCVSLFITLDCWTKSSPLHFCLLCKIHFICPKSLSVLKD